MDDKNFCLRAAARERAEVRGAPEKSDVTMRSLFPRSREKGDSFDTLEAVRGFHVTHLEWTYGADAEFIRSVHDLGVTFGGAAAAGNYTGDAPHEEWNVVDLKGEPVYAPWMRAWERPNPWGCANNPEFRDGHLRFLKSIIDAGADLIQRDEPRQNERAFRWGGCFCNYCMEGFNEWLDENADREVLDRLGVDAPEKFSYRDHLIGLDAPVGDDFNEWKGDELKDYFEQFQTESTIEFIKWWRQELHDHAGRYVPVSCNNAVLWRWEVHQLFDYWIGELHHTRATPEFLYDAMNSARDYGKTQSTTMPLYNHGDVSPDWIQLIRQTIATTYAIGGHMEMPWDTYLPTPDADRFFGDPKDYADLTAFVHSISHYLDGYADAAAYGGEIRDDRWSPGEEPVRLEGGEELYAFTRVKPGDPDAPVVIHLIDWRDEPLPFRLSVVPEAVFGDRPLSFRLYTPVSYDEQAHEKAFETGEYGAMARRTELADGYFISVDIPALHPWGVLVLKPYSR